MEAFWWVWFYSFASTESLWTWLWVFTLIPLCSSSGLAPLVSLPPAPPLWFSLCSIFFLELCFQHIFNLLKLLPAFLCLQNTLQIPWARTSALPHLIPVYIHIQVFYIFASCYHVFIYNTIFFLSSKNSSCPFEVRTSRAPSKSLPETLCLCEIFSALFCIEWKYSLLSIFNTHWENLG